MRNTLTLVALLAFGSIANAQIKVEGPKDGTVGYRVKAKLTVDVADMKLKCFPVNEDWMGVTDFEGQKWIDFVPGRRILTDGKAPVAGEVVKPKLFTFVVAGNKGGKTYLETWEITISPDDYVPPGPGPLPPGPPVPLPDTQLMKDLKAAYLVFPDATSKAKLAAVYEKLASDAPKFKNFKEAAAQLSAEAPAAVGTNLQPVRDVVAEYLLANVGRQGSLWDQEKLVAALRRVITCLQAL